MVRLTEDSVEQLDLAGVLGEFSDDPSYESTRDGEEFEFVISLLRALDKLKNGELLIIEVDRF